MAITVVTQLAAIMLMAAPGPTPVEKNEIEVVEVVVLDKSGTTTFPSENGLSQVLANYSLTKTGSSRAEGKGLAEPIFASLVAIAP